MNGINFDTEKRLGMKRKLEWDESIGILFFLISAGMLFVCVYLCFSGDIWYDELFTMGLANQSCGELIAKTARDVHPPLYYLIVKFFLTGVRNGSLQQHVTVAKLTSCLSFFLCMLFSLSKIRKHFGTLTAGLFSFLLISMPQLAGYAVEIRMYGYALLFITVGLITAYELTKESRTSGWILLTLCALCACYTHYFACVAACMVYLFLLISLYIEKKLKQTIRPYALSSMVCIVGYLPWLLMVVTRQAASVKENYWIQPVSLRTLGGCAKFIFMPALADGKMSTAAACICFLLYALTVAAGFFSMWKKGRAGKKEDAGCLLACGGIFVLAGVVLFGMIISVLIKPIFVYRYMLPAMGVFWLSFAIFAGLNKEKKRTVIPLLFFLGVIGIANFRSFYGEEMWKRLQMENALLALSRIESDDIILYNFDQTQGVASYYLSNETYLWYGKTEELIAEMFPFNHTLVEGEFTDEKGIARIREFLDEGKNLWFFGSGNAREEILKKWEEAEISSEEKASVMIERYWFNIYRMTAG